MGKETKKVKATDAEIQKTKDMINKRAEALRGIMTQDAFQNAMAKLGVGQSNFLEGTQYPMMRLGYNYNLFNSMYRGSWIVRKICDVPASDMIRNWIKIKTDLGPDELTSFDKIVMNTGVKRKLIEGIKWGRLFGGAAALMLIDGQADQLDQPLDYDSLHEGCFKGLLVFDRWSGIYPDAELISDINDVDFGLPKYYNIFTNVNPSEIGQNRTPELKVGNFFKVHHSRILRFSGRDLPLWEKQYEQYWGESEIEIVLEEIKKRDNTSYNLANLIFLANLRVLKMSELGQVLSVGTIEAQKELYNVVSAQTELMSNLGLYIMDKEDDFQVHNYTFSGLDEIYQSFMLDVAGAAEMPVTKLFGREPAGFNSTGESDLKQYYDTIAEKQQNYLLPILNKLFPVICMSAFGSIPDDFDWEFNPARNISNDELADLTEKYTSNIIEVFNAGLITKSTALKELKQQSSVTGQWSNITDEEIDAAEQEDKMNDISEEDQNEMSEELSEANNINPLKEQKSSPEVTPEPQKDIQDSGQPETWRERYMKTFEGKRLN